MAQRFSDESWAAVFQTLREKGAAAYGIPERKGDSLVFGSWNIRKFGALAGDDGTNRSAGAWSLIENFSGACDLLAIQEVQADMSSVKELVARLNRNGQGQYGIIASDVTGRAQGEDGMGERFVLLHRTDKFRIGSIVSDITFDQTAVIARVNEALAIVRKNIRASDDSSLGRAFDWLKEFTGFDKSKLPSMFDFVRAPHCANIRATGSDGSSYEFAVVNAHLVSGRPKEREREFFALLEWLAHAISGNNFDDATAVVLMADLNLDFDKTNDVRRLVIEEFITKLNDDGLDCRVNFPFLDPHPKHGAFRTNSRSTETYDHIAFFSKDDRLPRGRHNRHASSDNPDGYDYGMFDFVGLFRDAGALSGNENADYLKFEFDLSDHMPIWTRLPSPSAGQRRYVIA